MSKEAGRAALNLEFSERIPRVEYSAHFHWDLVRAVTGIDTSAKENRPRASREFVKAWDYAWFWSTPVNREWLARRGRITRMGHALYSENEAGFGDYDSRRETPFADPESAFALDPVKEYGRFDHAELIRELENHYAAQAAEHPDALPMGGVYITLFSGLIEIFGWETLLAAAAMDERRFGRVIDGYFEWIKQFFEAYAASSVPVIMSHDDLCWTSGPVFHPDWYRRHIFPKIKKLWQPCKEAGKKVMFTCDGDWTEFFDDIVDCGADMVVMEPSADMELFARRHGKRCGFTGNADTRILLSGSRTEIRAEVERCLNIGREYPGFILAVGNHIPPNTPVENALYYDECYRKTSKR